MAKPIYDIEVETLEGEKHDLHEYEGSVMLIVNTASKCGFTPQYADLQKLWEDYRDQGLVVLGFPCNQFGKQEPGDEAAIGAFCEKNYGVTFPMNAKIDVNGRDAHPLFELLKEAAPGALGTRSVKWNFTKFLVDRKGNVLGRHAPKTSPDDLRSEVEAALGDK